MAETVDLTQQPTGSILPFLRKLLTQEPQGPPVPPPEQDPQPDFSQTQPQAPPQPPPNPMADLTQPQDQGAPKLAGETKGHKLLRILLGTGFGGVAGAGQMTAGAGFQKATEAAQNRQLFPQQLEHGALQNEQVRQMLPFLKAQQFAGLGKTQAETAKMNAEVQGMPIKQALEQAQAEAANYKDDPNLGLIDLRTRQPVNPAGFVPLTPEEAQVLGKQPGEKVPIKLKNTASEIVNRGFTTVNTEEGVYERNRGTGSMTRLGSNPRMMFAPSERIIQVADPNKPGETTFAKAGTAVSQGLAGPTSASVQVPKAVAKKATSGNWADQKIAFNTAIQHAELLRDAAKALNNGDIRALNSLKNKLATEFGDPDLTSFEAIANAYNHEITSVISKGHITDNEVKTGDRTLPANANFKTIDKVLKNYQALAQSKMTQLQKQIDAGMKGNTGASSYTPPAGAPTATGPNNHRIVYDQGKWVDAATGQPIE
jgi:hypothetical protein